MLLLGDSILLVSTKCQEPKIYIVLISTINVNKERDTKVFKFENSFFASI